MSKEYTYNDRMNQLARHQMLSEVQMGVRCLSYEAFKRKAREHQVQFREHELGVGFYKYPNVLNYTDARKGLIFFEGFRQEIMDELSKPIAKTSAAPSAQMLTNLLRSEHIPYNIFFPMKKTSKDAGSSSTRFSVRAKSRTSRTYSSNTIPNPLRNILTTTPPSTSISPIPLSTARPAASVSR